MQYVTDARYHHEDDERVVAMAQAGSRAAEDYLLQKYCHIIEYKTRCFFLPGADREDVVQEGMIGLFKAIRDYRPGSSFRTFADLCVGRQIITAVKTATRQKQLPMNAAMSLEDEDDEGVVIHHSIVDRRTPERVVIEGQVLGFIVEKMVEELSPLEAATAACFIEDCTYDEAASRLGRGVKCIDNARQRVKTKLGRFLSQIA